MVTGVGDLIFRVSSPNVNVTRPGLQYGFWVIDSLLRSRSFYLPSKLWFSCKTVPMDLGD